MNYMKGKIFIDTNVLVYLFSVSEPQKREHCLQILAKRRRDSVLVWSTQIVQEFYNVMTLKFNKDLQAVKSTLNLFNDFELIINNFRIIEHAIDIQILNKISFWDSLVISSASSAKCQLILTEDLNHSQSIDGILLQNPFELSV